MSIDEMRSRLGEVRDELETLLAEDSLTEEQEERFDTIEAEAAELSASIEKREAREARLSEIRAAADAGRTEPAVQAGVNINTRTGSDPFDVRDLAPYGRARTDEARGRAIAAIEADRRFVADSHKANAIRALDRLGHIPGVAEMILLRTDERYARAFYAAMSGEDLSPEQRARLNQVREVQRAMALSDVTGVLVPSQLDTTVILSNDGTTNPFRRVSRLETGTTNVWTGVSSAGITASWDAEAAEVSDDAPSFSNPAVTAFKGSAFVPISYEAYEDARGREGDIVRMIVDAKDRLESTAFATGNGTSAPRGIVTALDANTNVEVATTTSNVFGLVDVYSLYESVPARWRDRSTFAANVAIINDIRQFGTNNLSTQTVDLTADGLTRVLGRPVVESSAMDGTIGTAGTDNILVLGDFSEYVIYDRLGLSVEFIPNLFGTTNARPTGQRGWMAHWRTGANTTVDTAFRILQAETNA